MTQDEIIEMANEVGIRHIELFGAKQFIEVWLPDLEAFANLVADVAAAKEREACAKRAEIALLGTLKTTSDRVLKAIRARGEANE